MRLPGVAPPPSLRFGGRGAAHLRLLSPLPGLPLPVSSHYMELPSTKNKAPSGSTEGAGEAGMTPIQWY